MSEPRRALVTGAARGIGAAIADRLRADGMEVETLDRDPGCDHQVDLGVDDLPDLSHIEVCVSNAGITDTVARTQKMLVEDWERDIGINLTGAFRVVQACLRGMWHREWGRIVVISSGAARMGLPGQVAYAASKAGLLGMVKTVAAEAAGRGVTANAVLPGMVATEKVQAMPPEIVERLTETLPTGRMAEPVEIAALVAFLASEGAGYITGEAIGIDGGMSLNTAALTRRDR